MEAFPPPAKHLWESPEESELAGTPSRLAEGVTELFSTRARNFGEALTHQQATSTLLSTYLNRSGSRRAIGLHGLMLYGSHTKGTKGDTFIANAHAGKKRAIPINLAK